MEDVSGKMYMIYFISDILQFNKNINYLVGILNTSAYLCINVCACTCMQMAVYLNLNEKVILIAIMKLKIDIYSFT